MTESGDIPRRGGKEAPKPGIAERVKEKIVAVVRSRLPEEKTFRSMDTLDRVLPHLQPNIRETVTKLRPVIQKGLYAGNCIGTFYEGMMIASVAMGGVWVLKNSLSPKQGAPPAPDLTTLQTAAPVKPSKSRINWDPETPTSIFLLQTMTWEDRTGGWLSRINLTELPITNLLDRLSVVPDDVKDSTINFNKLSPRLLKSICSDIALLGDDEKRKFALVRLANDGLDLWTRYREQHPPENDMCSIRANQVHFDTLYNWLSQRKRGDEPWITPFLARPHPSTPDLLRDFAGETGFSLAAFLAIRGDVLSFDVSTMKNWIRQWYDG